MQPIHCTSSLYVSHIMEGFNLQVQLLKPTKPLHAANAITYCYHTKTWNSN